MTKFTLLIPSRNDVDQALELVAEMHDIADDIVIIDSSDSAQKKRLYRAARQYGSKLRIFDGIAFGYSEPLREYAHKKCRYDWVLRLDTDERPTPKLKQSIKKLISSSKYKAFAIRVRNTSKSGNADEFFAWQIQLYRKSAVRFKGLIHEQPSVEGLVKKLENADMFIEHEITKKHTAAREYPQMEKLERMSYRMYNAAITDGLAKMYAIRGRGGEKSLLQKAVSVFMHIYEKATFRNLESEISGFDYWVYYSLRELAYAFRSRRLKVVCQVPFLVSKYVEMIRRSRNAPDGDEMFEIAKIIHETGLIKFLRLDDEKEVERLVKKYRGKPQGAVLLLKLLKERYASMQRTRFKYENIVISPHIDDAFFSLGGLLLKNRGKKQKVVNVFSTSDFTIAGRINVERSTKMRRREELRNARKVGVDVDFIGFRNIGSRSPGRELRAPVRKKLKRYLEEGRRVFFPLGIGGHGDHVFLARIGLELARLNASDNIYFYEDLPYAIRSTLLFSLFGAFVKTNSAKVFPVINPKDYTSVLKPEYINFSSSDKLELCKNYESQIDCRILLAISCYGRMLGHLVSSRERIWRVHRQPE